MAVYGPGCHPQNFIKATIDLVDMKTEAKSDDMFFFNCISKIKNEFEQNPKENIIWTGLVNILLYIDWLVNKDK
jgi:hypothetical protein